MARVWYLARQSMKFCCTDVCLYASAKQGTWLKFVVWKNRNYFTPLCEVSQNCVALWCRNWFKYLARQSINFVLLSYACTLVPSKELRWSWLKFFVWKNRNYFTPLCEVNQNRVALWCRNWFKYLARQSMKWVFFIRFFWHVVLVLCLFSKTNCFY